MNMLSLAIGLNPSPFTQALFDGSVQAKGIEFVFNPASAKALTTSAHAIARSSQASLTAASFPSPHLSWRG